MKLLTSTPTVRTQPNLPLGDRGSSIVNHGALWKKQQQESSRQRVLQPSSSLAQQLLSFQPEAGFERSLGQEITFAHPTEAGPSAPGPSAPGPSDPTPRDINHRPRPPKPKKQASTPRGLLGASLRKHNLAVSQGSPIVRASPNDNQARTPQRTPRRRARCVEQNTSASGTCESQSPSHSQRNQGRATSSGHEPNHTAPQVDFCHLARDLP